jgi:hypothetical protein
MARHSSNPPVPAEDPPPARITGDSLREANQLARFLLPYAYKFTAASSLDSASETLVLQAFDRLMQGRTSLLIAHRLSTVRGVDRIVVIKDGCTVESGTHAELLQRDDGVYRTLSQLQLDLTGSPRPDVKEEDIWPPTSPSPHPLIPLRRP